MRCGAVLGGDLDLEGVRAHRECDGAARRAARDRGEARPLAHLHRGVGFVDRRGELHVGSGIGHRHRVGRGARGEGADAQRSERARGARAARRRQGGQGRVGGLRRCHGLRSAGRADAELLLGIGCPGESGVGPDQGLACVVRYVKRSRADTEFISCQRGSLNIRGKSQP